MDSEASDSSLPAAGTLQWSVHSLASLGCPKCPASSDDRTLKELLSFERWRHYRRPMVSSAIELNRHGEASKYRTTHVPLAHKHSKS